MRIGVFTVLFNQFPFEEALDKIAATGVTAVEIGTGGQSTRCTAPWTI
jgi:sugar phosphate isomerase/epimerase